MARPRNKAYLQPYREAVDRFGAGFEATLWKNPEMQRLRFDVMIDLAAFAGASVLDVGCGQGDFAARLLEREVAFASYAGIDALPEMIAAAAGRGLDRCTFTCGDPVEDPALMTAAGADLVCISGTLNTMSDKTAQRLVGYGFAAARRGLVFNFLSGLRDPRWAGRDPSPARRFDPLRWIDFALGLSRRVSFTQGYLDGHDATIYVEQETTTP
jgi:SAM-dependent methyltransferase